MAQCAIGPTYIFMQRCSRDERTHMADMQVIVRLQDRDALCLDHLHDQALCESEGAVIFRSPT